MRTTVHFVERESLTPLQITHMWEIYKTYYNYTHASFLERIETNTLYALYVKGDKICGFTGLRINELRVDGRDHFLIYFGQTILPWGLKGKQLFPITTGKLVLKFWRKILLRRTWVWFDALSFKAYWIPASLVRDFYPNRYQTKPAHIRNLMSRIGKHYYGDNYCEATNIVSKPMPFVKQAHREIPKSLLSNPDVAFYAARNPGSQKGHGLLTIVPLNWKNLCFVLTCLFKKFDSPKRHLEYSKSNPNPTIITHANSENKLPTSADTTAMGFYSIQ